MQVFVHLSRWGSHTKSNDLHLSDARSSTIYWTFSSVVIKHALSTLRKGVTRHKSRVKARPVPGPRPVKVALLGRTFTDTVRKNSCNVQDYEWPKLKCVATQFCVAPHDLSEVGA